MSRRAAVAGALALAGGVAVVVGSFLPWAEISAGPFTEKAMGIDGWEGKAAIVGGLIMIVGGARVLAGAHRSVARLRPGATIGGLLSCGVGLYTAITSREQLLDAAQGQLSRADIERALDSGLLELSIAIGLIVVIAGGAQGIVAALLSMGVSDEQAPTPSGSGLRGWSSETTDDGASEPSPTSSALLPPPPPPPDPEPPG